MSPGVLSPSLAALFVEVKAGPVSWTHQDVAHEDSGGIWLGQLWPWQHGGDVQEGPHGVRWGQSQLVLQSPLKEGV